jgi:hypothetical protein
MTVSELIAQLRLQPADAEALTYDEHGDRVIESVEPEERPSWRGKDKKGEEPWRVRRVHLW